MLSKAQSKHIRGLYRQKYRKEAREFLVQGTKIARECLIANGKLNQILCTPEWAARHEEEIGRHPEARLSLCAAEQIEAHSSLVNGNEVILILPRPEEGEIEKEEPWVLAVDRIQDPGNLGTLIRIADWFGLSTLVCSPDSADPYQPKAIQAAMGSHLRVKAYERDLSTLLADKSRPVYAGSIQGDSIFETPSGPRGVLLIGNESAGLDPALLERAHHPVRIPSYGGGAESLNAAVSAGILLSHLLPRP